MSVAAACAHEPGLRFWLRYAEDRGALIEDAGDHALALLPGSLQAVDQLPEEVAVTSDPDVAGEDGAILMIPGHPALERAATSVLEEGDVGRVHLPWPASMPGTAEVQARARERFHIEHGRIDAAGDARRAYMPLLRVGAMISYATSLTHRFQEQEQAWVDARTGLVLAEGVLEAVHSRPWLPEPDATATPLDADLPLALRGAHAQLEQGAADRLTALGAQARRALELELARADAYYHGAVESIERRRAGADPDRRRLLDGQAEATRAEHARRRREIAEEFEPHHEIRPFRLHLVLVPGLVLPVDIRRGARTFPFSLAWLAAGAGFADARCPHCSAAAGLVAGRERLGCRSCLPSTAAPATSPRASGGSRPAPPVLAVPASAPAGPSRATARRVPGHGSDGDTGRAARPRSKPAVSTPSAGSPRTSASRQRDRGAGPGKAQRTGNKLALAFWQAVAGGTRWPRKKVAGDSPLAVLYRLYGPAGPLCALGVPPRRLPSEVTAATLPHEAGCPQMTTGEVTAGGIAYPYTLSWWLEAGKPVIAEVMPAPHPLVLAANGAEEIEVRLREQAPAPGADLDSVAAALWEVELASHGLPVAIRCLAAWWRVRESVDEAHAESTLAAAAAAAVAGAVAHAAG
ncbi:MAG: hypothetical protein M3459_03215, partial [Actinomycetota bacterium]|nr:hypothetical protein [Actinomycetota bacterium]